jgi:hypothetical protein
MRDLKTTLLEIAKESLSHLIMQKVYEHLGVCLQTDHQYARMVMDIANNLVTAQLLSIEEKET